MNVIRYIRKDKFLFLMLFIWVLINIFFFLPFFKYVSNLKFSINNGLSAFSGIFLGPIYGSLAILIILFIYMITNLFQIEPFMLVPPVISTLVVGWLCEKRWRLSLHIIAFGTLILYYLIIFLKMDNYLHIPYAVIVSIAIIYIIKDKFDDYLFSSNIFKVLLSSTSLSFISIVTGHIYEKIVRIITGHKLPKICNVFINLPIIILLSLFCGIFVTVTLIALKFLIIRSPDLRDKILTTVLREEVKPIKHSVDEELLKKYGVKIPDENEQLEVLKTLAIFLSENKKLK
ncbi:hypothetical protein J422_04765 [Methanocaldococcus villosus KIN24-T80]|uniref:Uncharacterized protein n=1 Tax=Methanocaldococcus villosus KIN24-T80 TaxID=1069083 RepID=N6UUK7_9EURY|nr:hypothetical protein [Methanocaldococcus villosus]ENN96024.1 hypothetical protein J422_04765 [Methanocaldococcus villosus KIN24-T80]